MYDLNIGLTYENFLQLSGKYRYDFLAINPSPGYGFGPLNSSVFVFRTIKESYLSKKESINNVLVDVIHYSNVNAFDTAIHGDCHFHILDIKNLNQDDIVLTDIISLKIIKDETGKAFYAIAKNQKIICIDKIHKDNDNPAIEINELKHMLFKINNSDIINCKKIELAKIFNLQVQDIWHCNRYYNYNNLSNLDIDNSSNNKLDPSTSWKDVKEIIKQKREFWKIQQDTTFDNLVTEHWSLNYKILE